MPKLELLGNFILSQLMVTVISALEGEIKIDDHFCWSDSMVSVAWKKATDKVFKVFIQNRVVKIRNDCGPYKWNYCSTKDNPADLITRFYSGNLTECKSWLGGSKMIQIIGDSLPKKRMLFALI